MYTINKKCSLLFFVQNAILNVYRKPLRRLTHRRMVKKIHNRGLCFMLRKMKKAVALLAAAAMMTSIFATTVWAADVPETAVSAAKGIFVTTA